MQPGRYTSKLVVGILCSWLSLGGCGAERNAPGLVLAFQSDMSVPKDVKAVGLYIRVVSGAAERRILYNGIVKAEANRVQFPSTFVLASTGSPAVTRIQLVAYRLRTVDPYKGLLEPFIVRDTTTTVPTDRLARLRMPLLWINQDSVTKETRDEWAATQPEDIAFEDGFPTSCSSDGSKIFRGGACVAADPDASALPDYKPEVDDPTKVSTCFDAEACFGKTTQLSWNATDCSVATGTADVQHLNLALITADGAGIEIKGTPSTFLVPLDQDPTKLEGYYIDQKRVFLSKVVCNALKSGRATGLTGTGACGAKTANAQLCGPWNPAKTKAGPSFPPDLPGVIPEPPTPLLGTVVIGGEPSIQDFAIVGDTIYFVRLSESPGFTERLVVAPKTGGNALTPVTTSQVWPSDTNYRVRAVTFPQAGGWNGRSGVLVTNEPKGVAYLVTGTGPDAKMEPLQNLGGVAPATGDIGPAGEVVVIGKTAKDAQVLSFATPAEPTIRPLATANPSVMFANGNRSQFYFGGRQETVLVRRCLSTGPFDCTTLAGLETPQADASILDMAADDTYLWALVARGSAGAEFSYEGLYRAPLGGGTLSPVLVRAQDPTLHFHAADGTGQNRLAVGAQSVYFTTDPLDKDAASVREFRKSTLKGSVFVTGFTAVKGLVLDGADVFYSAQGVPGSPSTIGNIYRKPLSN